MARVVISLDHRVVRDDEFGVNHVEVTTIPPAVFIDGNNVDEVQRADRDGLVLNVEVSFPLNQRPTLSINGGPDELDKYLQTSGSIDELIIADCEGYNYRELELGLNCEGFNNVTVLLQFE